MPLPLIHHTPKPQLLIQLCQPTPGTCPGHVDCTVLAVLKGTEEADSLFQAADSLEAVKTSGWTGWNTHTMNMTGVLLAQDWSFRNTDFIQLTIR